jgi:putative flippase GtrA
VKDPGRYIRWWKFNAVGLIGIVVQTGALWLLKSGLGVPPQWAIALAVEIAVLHNYAWHELWTWGDRRGPGKLGRLIRFNLSNGLVSIAVNVLAMRILAGRYHVHYMIANLAGIACGALANFLLGEFFVFKAEPAKAARD